MDEGVEGATKDEPALAGAVAPAGTYGCTNCGYRLRIGSNRRLPPCPECGNIHWYAKRRREGKHS